jgi:TRAP-type transport system periplasmic protein
VSGVISRRGLLAGGGAALLAAAAAACGSSGGSGSGGGAAAGSGGGGAGATMKIGWNLAPDDPLSKGMASFKTAVEKSTNGQIKVQLYGGGVLGAADHVVQSVQANSVQGNIGATSVVATSVPKLGVLDIPYGWRDWQHVTSVLEGPVGDQLRTTARNQGFEIVDFWPGGTRNLTNLKHSVQAPGDMQGLKVRTLGKVWGDYFSALGAVPQNVAFTEVYLDLQTKLLDGAETALDALIGAKVDEVCDFWTVTDHGYQVAAFTVSKTWYDGLSRNLQQAVTAAAKGTRDQVITNTESADAAAIAQLTSEHKTVVRNPNRSAFESVAKSKIWPGLQQQYGDVFNQIVNAT